jgi:dipeptidyl aminopeptidase/acylaminoacyl peptidase
VSPRGDLVAIQVDAGNRSEIRLLHAKGLTVKTRVKAPLGTAVLGEFTRDGTLLTMGLSTPDSPPEPYAVSTATGESRKLRDDPRPGAKLVAVDTSIESAKAFDGKPIPLNVSLPRDRGDRRLPVIVEFHGGPAASSEVSWNPFTQFFASLGYAVVHPNVRGSTGFGRAWEMADNRERRGHVLKDMESVNRWVRAQPWADPQRIVIAGGSYGGYLVLMGLTRQPDLWSAGVDLVGVADLSTLLRSTDQLIRAVFVDEFGDLEKDAALLAEWSPLADASKIADPLFVYQGANDPRVTRSESDAIVGALRQRNVPVEYMVAPDEGHSLARRPNRIEYLSRVGRFLEEHLSKRGQATRQPLAP